MNNPNRFNLRIIPEDKSASSALIPVVGKIMNEEEVYQLALDIALQGTGNVSPNPLVGAVCVDQGMGFVSAASHLKCGQDHAEVSAIKKAVQLGFKPADLSIYVTLEPCAHHGKTPSCAKLIAEIGIKKVFYALKDPNPLVSGVGNKIIAQRGIQCDRWKSHVGEAEKLVEIFLHSQKSDRPFIGLKIASDFSGAFAHVGDKRNFITNSRARSYGHYLRMRYDAIAVGATTLINDTPSLDPRDIGFKPRSPIKIVYDNHGRALKKLIRSPGSYSNLFTGQKIIWFSKVEKFTSDAEKLGITVLNIESMDEQLKHLRQIGITSLLVEGGAGLWESFVRHRAVDKIHWFCTPTNLVREERVIFGYDIWRLLETRKSERQTQLGSNILREYSVQRSDFFDFYPPTLNSLTSVRDRANLTEGEVQGHS